MKGVLLSVGVLAAVVAFVHPERLLSRMEGHFDPFRTPAAFAQQADAICAEYERSGSYLSQSINTANSWTAAQSFAARVLAVAQREVAKLHALALPTKDRALAESWIAGQDRIVVLLRQLRVETQREDKARSLMVVVDLEANADTESQLAFRLGMNDCSNL